MLLCRSKLKAMRCSVAAMVTVVLVVALALVTRSGCCGQGNGYFLCGDRLVVAGRSYGCGAVAGLPWCWEVVGPTAMRCRVWMGQYAMSDGGSSSVSVLLGACRCSWPRRVVSGSGPAMIILAPLRSDLSLADVGTAACWEDSDLPSGLLSPSFKLGGVFDSDNEGGVAMAEWRRASVAACALGASGVRERDTCSVKHGCIAGPGQHAQHQPFARVRHCRASASFCRVPVAAICGCALLLSGEASGPGVPRDGAAVRPSQQLP